MAIAEETNAKDDTDGERPRSRYRQFREHPLVIRMLGIGSELLPKGLYARALLIIITPIVVLEGVIAFAFMERHWQAVTRRLSEATARDIAALIEVYSDLPKSEGAQKIVDLARERLNLKMEVLPPGDLPPPGPKPFFRLLDRALSNELRKHVQLPFWIDTVGESQNVEIRVKRDDAILRFVATRSQTYASNSHIFLLWMVGSSVILLTVAILFLRNQIRPVLRLADAADAFGKGRSIPEDFRPRGAREVRQAASAFLQMSDRIKQHVEQRTTMLAGVSHDLRTVLTRFKLELALLGDTAESRALASDVNEMQHMLEAYLAFAKGDGGEEAVETNLADLLQEIVDDAAIHGWTIDLRVRKSKGEIVLPLKRRALKRAITNLVTNAARFGDQIVVRVAPEGAWVRIEVDDNGPGIPASERENVFRPFYRLDHARNQDDGNSGLGLAIARDIAKSHGGEIALGESSMGGLRAIISLPQ
ncbi:two-component sensor histidine kinase [Hyphomicrobium methylovorum]|uniref:ATP-binding protein n=1 Tax=Hyphomicrobium methylovorum TaxID=84 RepID=UPI0015E76CA3|nr:ATP-binding protein [Hyphomicrobium methylovorum]MBA2126942.1 two-component sensor histidine kinase [Hyphomicrobium methylovorum]